MAESRGDSAEPLRVFLVDDDRDVLDAETALLEQAGYRVECTTSSQEALAQIPRSKPDVILIDIMMPELDGLELCGLLRNRDDLGDPKIIVVSAKAYEYDRKRALKIGADGFIVKPIAADRFVAHIEKIIEDQIVVTFWGVRGTLPVPGERALRYGGNTSCVSLEFSKGQFFIFDAGTGIKELSNHLLAQGRKSIEAKIFISHPHWDHINALPFFAPLYVPGNDFEICGAAHGDKSVSELISAQMDDVYFPITIKEFGARVHFRELREESLEVDNIVVKTMLLSHPGYCLGFRVEYGDRAICYITDNELYLEDDPAFNPHYEAKLTKFIAGATLLITDVTYLDEEYLSRVGWGHSCVGKVVELAHRAGVDRLCLYHHDPDQDDDAISDKLERACEALEAKGSATRCVAPREGDSFKI